MSSLRLYMLEELPVVPEPEQVNWSNLVLVTNTTSSRDTATGPSVNIARLAEHADERQSGITYQRCGGGHRVVRKKLGN